MAKIVRTCRVHCSSRHLNAFVTEWDDGHVTVKCSLMKYCGDSCPFLKDPNYKSEFRRAPEYNESRGKAGNNPWISPF